MKKFLISIVLTVALLCAGLVGCSMPASEPSGAELDALKAEAVAVFTLDVNPGVRIYVKADNTVITVEATNEDGEQVVAEIDCTGDAYDVAVEEIISEIEEQGFVEGETGSVLISVEKNDTEISDNINEKVELAFEKCGKKVAVIEQNIEEIDEAVSAEIEEIAERHKISKGKAHLIEKLREEFPELSEEELAELNIRDLGIILDDASEHVKDHFKKLDKHNDDNYIGKEAALDAAIAGIEAEEAIDKDSIAKQHVHFSHEDGKMVYEVEFVYGESEYEITVNAESGEILEIEIEDFEEFDPQKVIDDFCEEHSLSPEEMKDKFFRSEAEDEIEEDDEPEHAEGDDKPKKEEPAEGEVPQKPLSRGEILSAAIETLELQENSLRKTDVKYYGSESGNVYNVTLKTVDGDVYKLVLEAYSGEIVKAEKNGNVIELTVAEVQ